MHNVVLEEIDLRSNRIGPVGFASLCSCFKDNSSLKKIIVIYYFKIAFILTILKSFFFLKIGKNQINNEALEAVFKLFLTLSQLSLELLDVSVEYLGFYFT